MTSIKPKVEPTGRYSIADTANHLGVSTRTIQRYIKDKTLKAEYRKANKKPFITGLEIIRAWQATY